MIIIVGAIVLVQSGEKLVIAPLSVMIAGKSPCLGKNFCFQPQTKFVYSNPGCNPDTLIAVCRNCNTKEP